jgi:hypothetical protein
VSGNSILSRQRAGLTTQSRGPPWKHGIQASYHPARRSLILVVRGQKQMLAKTFYFFALFLIISSASALELTGQTTATPQLKIDVLKALIPMASAITQCKSIESIRTSVVTLPNDLQTNANGVVIKGSPTIERWVASGCNKTTAFKVTLTPDGVGGNYFNVSTAK